MILKNYLFCSGLLLVFCWCSCLVSGDYEDIKSLSLQIGQLYCINVPNISDVLWHYHSIKNRLGFGDFQELQSLLDQTKSLYSILIRQINYYAKSQHNLKFSNENYFNLMIYWRIRLIQCQSLFMVVKWIEQDLLKFRKNSTSFLRDVFDDGSFERNVANYIQVHHEKDLDMLNQLDYDIFDYVRKSNEHVTKENIIERLQKLYKSFGDVNNGLTKTVIAPTHDELYKTRQDFSMESHALIASTLSYYYWLTEFMRIYQEMFQDHYLR